MSGRRIVSAVLVAALTGCTSGPPSPPALAYGESAVESATYVQADTTSVDVSFMGQRMQLSQHGRAVYDVAFRTQNPAMDVVLTLRSLAATLNQPMGAPLRVDESSVDGVLEFTLDRRGDAVVVRRPSVAVEASQMVSGLGLAHTFFPALPGRPAVPGESWVDSLSFSGDEGPGTYSESSVLRYTVVGDTLVGGRSLLRIDFEGSMSMTNDMEFSGMPIHQESELDVAGTVLWDVQGGLMVERTRTESGSGTVRVPIAPLPLPITITSVQRTRLERP
jgi:hypothetical protein